MVLVDSSELTDETVQIYRSAGDTTVLVEPGKVATVSGDKFKEFDSAGMDTRDVVVELCVSHALRELNALRSSDT